MLSRRSLHKGVLGTSDCGSCDASRCEPSAEQLTRSLQWISHAHVFKRGLPLADTRRYAPDYDATPEQYIEGLGPEWSVQRRASPAKLLGYGQQLHG